MNDVQVESTQISWRPAAVIDIGATSIRMAIAEISDSGGVRTIETLSQAVNLGKDTFTKGAISKTTIEECVAALSRYRQMLGQYQIDQPDQIRVVATSGVREASNRLAFLDRVFIATGFDIDPIDEAEVARITYLGIQPYIHSEPALANAKVLVAEVSGGNTEMLFVKDGNVAFAHSYRLGSLRLRKTLEEYRAPAVKRRHIMETQIRRTVDQMMQSLPETTGIKLIALGGDIRFAATQLLRDWEPTSLATIPLPSLERLAEKLLSMTEDEVVQKYHISFPEADTVGLAMLAYVHFAQALKLDNVMATNTNLRDGLLNDMAAQAPWANEFRQQLIRSALNLGRRYKFDEKHAVHVADLSRKLFGQLQSEHQLGPTHETLLYVAALLHEIGLYISHRSNHKHTMYLINNSELFGLGKKDLLLVALVARYHRRASPQPRHEGFSSLSRDERIVVSKLAAILRIAVALDESRNQRIEDFRCSFEPGRLVISISQVEDLSLEQLAVRQNGSLFDEIFGRTVFLQYEQC